MSASREENVSQEELLSVTGGPTDQPSEVSQHVSVDRACIVEG